MLSYTDALLGTGDQPTRDHLNTYLRQGVIICTSTTRPSDPHEGMMIYETDTHRFLEYTTSTTGWRRPWNSAWGLITTTNVTSSALAVSGDLIGPLTASDYAANRILRCTAIATLHQSGASGNVLLTVQQGGIQIGQGRQTLGDDWYSSIVAIGVFTTITGDYDFKSVVSTSAGTVDLIASASEPASLVVEDLGPSAAPV